MITIHCFPYSGGGASLFRRWQSSLPLGVQVRPFQLPGREERFDEEPFRSFEAVMQHMREVLLPSLTPPYALFGHSMGALIAFEIAREMRRRGAALPVRLFVSGTDAPQMLRFENPVHARTDAAVLEHLRMLGGASDDFLADAELQQLFLPLLRSDFRVAETFVYRDEPPLPCPISMFAGTEDRLTTPSAVDRWREQTSGDFRLRWLPGDHQFVNSAQAELLTSIGEDLGSLAAPERLWEGAGR